MSFLLLVDGNHYDYLAYGDECMTRHYSVFTMQLHCVELTVLVQLVSLGSSSAHKRGVLMVSLQRRPFYGKQVGSDT